MEYNDTILTFDTLYTTNEIQLLKLALPLLSNQLQPIAATLIKMRELEYCLSRLPHTKIHDFSIAVDRLDTFFDSAMPFATSNRKAVFPAPADEAVHEDDGENADDPANASAGCHAI